MLFCLLLFYLFTYRSHTFSKAKTTSKMDATKSPQMKSILKKSGTWKNCPKKDVKFKKDAKEHDGLRDETRIFNEFMRNVFKVKDLEKFVCALMEQRDCLGLKRLSDNLEDLIAWCENSPEGRAPILLGGSRNSAGFIDWNNLPFLHKKVLPYLVRVTGIVKRENPSQKEAYRNSKKRKRQETQAKSFRVKLQRKFLSDEKT
jgi:hypothetical protein